MISRQAAKEHSGHARAGMRRWASAGVAVALLAGACSGGDGGDASAGSGSGATIQTDETTPGADTDTSGDAGSLSTAVGPQDGPEYLGSPLSGAESRVNEFRRRVADIAAVEKLAAFPTDQLVVHVRCPLPECEGASLGIDEAADLLGMRVEVIEHDGSEASIAGAWSAAADAGADAVIGRLANLSAAGDAINRLGAAGVPVVTWAADLPARPDNGITANLAGPDAAFFNGILLADYVAFATRDEENVSVHLIETPEVPVMAQVASGFRTELASACAVCTLTSAETSADSIQNGLDGAVLAAEVADVDWLVLVHGAMMTGVADQLEAAGLPADQLNVVSTSGGPTNFRLMSEGRYQVADVGLAAEFMGWRALDIIARELAGQSVGAGAPSELAVVAGRPDVMVDGMPVRYVENGIIDDPDEFWPGVDGFRNKFKEVWGL